MSMKWALYPCCDFIHALVTNRIHFAKHLEADLADKKLMRNALRFFLPFTTFGDPNKKENNLVF
jgi:hypothetical protein